MSKYLREAQENDADLLYHWVNEESVRRNAFHSEQISYDEHLNWFHRLLTSDRAKQYIYMCDEEPIGQARVEIDGDAAEIDYSIKADKRCMGHAKVMLNLLEPKVKQDFPGVTRLIARVKPSNVASQTVFRKLQYECKYEMFELAIGMKEQEEN